MSVIPQLLINRRRLSASQYVEDLNGTRLEMVSIRGGEFTMGSPAGELERVAEREEQQVLTVRPFFLGKYPVTQAQWKAVSGMERARADMNPDPSGFKGGDRPVENVFWYDVVEFCLRLEKATGRAYRLLGEDEWEYACRAGTTTPFHFGETITTDLANYRGTDDESLKWSGSYGDGPKGEYRRETTPVGSFKVANTFGLYDMHGNVWEWCADVFSEKFSPARPGGTPWYEVEGNFRVLRGGSWNSPPWYCRSAYRNGLNPEDRYNVIGFRVACSPARSSSPLLS